MNQHSEPQQPCRGVPRVRHYAALFFLYLAYLFLIWTYHIMFIEGADGMVSRDEIYSRIIIPDTFAYQSYRESPWNVLQNPNLKNYFGPVLLVYLMRNIAHGDLAINAIFMLLTGLVFVKLLNFLKIPRSWPLAVLLLNPETVFYSQGFLKEIPLLFCFSLFAYNFLRKRYLPVALAIALAAVFRYHIAIFMVMVTAFYLMPYRNKGRGAFAIALVLFLIMPVIYDRVAGQFVAASQEYYEAGSVFGLGKALTWGLQRIPLFGFIALPLRGLQNLFEPFPAVPLFVDYPMVSLSFIVASGSLLLMVSFYIVFIVQSWRLIIGKYHDERSNPLVVLLTVLLMALMFVGMNPFIHHRYVFLFLPLLPLLTYLGRPINVWPYALAIVAIYSGLIVNTWIKTGPT